MPKAKRKRQTFDCRGLECRVCGCRRWSVVYTDPHPHGVIVRRRECKHCGRRITTHEREACAKYDG